jgi:hypothetical protein
MTVNSRALWISAQVVTAVALMLVFFSWAPWLGNQSVSEVSPSVAASLPADCPAVSGSHGTYYCDYRGTVRSNPLGFATLTMLFFALFGTFLYIGFSGRGWSPTRGLPPNISLERTRER